MASFLVAMLDFWSVDLVNLYDFHVGKFSVRPMDPSWVNGSVKKPSFYKLLHSLKRTACRLPLFR